MEQITLRVTAMTLKRLQGEADALDRAARNQAEAEGKPAPRRHTTVEQAAAAVIAAEFERRDREAAKLRAWRRARKEQG